MGEVCDRVGDLDDLCTSTDVVKDRRGSGRCAEYDEECMSDRCGWWLDEWRLGVEEEERGTNGFEYLGCCRVWSETQFDTRCFVSMYFS